MGAKRTGYPEDVLTIPGMDFRISLKDSYDLSEEFLKIPAT